MHNYEPSSMQWHHDCFENDTTSWRFRYYKLRNLKARQRQTKTSHFFVYSRRATHDPHHTWCDDRGGPCHFCTPLFFYPISSFAARGYWKFVGKFPVAGKCL